MIVMKRICLATAALLLFALPAFAFFSFGDVDGAPGWKFRTLTVIKDSVFVTVINDTDRTANFTGRIHFIGFMNDVIGKSRIYHAKFAPRSEQDFTSYLYYQKQNVAQALRVEWGEVTVDYLNSESK